ncbi:MAG: hypothetical protein MI867_29710 [Pseudomonadales bacterium]|nr:hypothetical protein [Pseudomonadales bacterium]
MDLVQEFLDWDGKSASDIEAIYSRHSDDASLVPRIIELSAQVDFQKAATWLLKRHLEGGQKLEANETVALFELLPQLENWETMLHLLQCLPYLQIGATKKKDVEVFLRKCLVNSNKFVRAWAYNGFYEISLQYPEYKEETKQFFEMAMRDEAPSVKARIRNIMKKGF